jgi:hypothetical protein
MLNSRMRDLYCAMAANQRLEVALTDKYGGRQLMVRAKEAISSSSALKGLEFICFPIPPDDQVPPKYKGLFNEEYCLVNKKQKGFIQLGPASLLNVSTGIHVLADVPSITVILRYGT